MMKELILRARNATSDEHLALAKRSVIADKTTI